MVLASNHSATSATLANYGGLDSLLNQAMYFGQSFGRIGADFRLSLVPIFKEAALDLALGVLQGADVKFAQDIDQLALKATVTSTNAANSKILEKRKDDSKTAENDEAARHNDDFSPPVSLLEFVPLAELCNAILSSFNEIRLITPLAICPQLVSGIQYLLESAAKTLAER